MRILGGVPTHVDPRATVERERERESKVRSLLSLLAYAKNYFRHSSGVCRVYMQKRWNVAELHACPRDRARARARAGVWACVRARAYARHAFDCILRIYSDQRVRATRRSLSFSPFSFYAYAHAPLLLWIARRGIDLLISDYDVS